jgi:hypothetical protein
MIYEYNLEHVNNKVTNYDQIRFEEIDVIK